MNKTVTILATSVLATTLTTLAGSLAADQPTAATVTANSSSGGFLESINNKGFGTFSGRIQFLGMYRDYEGVPGGEYGHASTLGALLEYTSPTFHGFSIGAAYNYAGPIYDGGNTNLLANEDINILNEAWLRYQPEAFGLEKSAIVIGRKVTNGEVFRKDDFRQKARSLETLQFTSNDIEDVSFTVGHATRMSNWIDAGDLWKFNDFGDVFKTGYNTDGVTWGEVVYTGLEGWNISIFDGYAWDVTNLIGTRIQYNICDEASLIGYYRHEGSVGKADTQTADAWGLSYQQKLENVTLETGYFGVGGSNLRFQELTTGINHALGSSMMVCACQFNEGANTLYLKGSTKINKTVLYGLYNYTWQDHNKHAFDAQELNAVVKQIITDEFSVCVKAGVGYRDGKMGADSTTYTDARLFMTYTF
jgi:hypothetical protein